MTGTWVALAVENLRELHFYPKAEEFLHTVPNCVCAPCVSLITDDSEILWSQHTHHAQNNNSDSEEPS